MNVFKVVWIIPREQLDCWQPVAPALLLIHRVISVLLYYMLDAFDVINFKLPPMHISPPPPRGNFYLFCKKLFFLC